MSDITFESRTKALKDMRGGHYEAPSSNNMLSHLTHERAFKDYKYANARKLVKQQEDLLRNLAKARQSMEFEEHQIGRVKDFYAGSREEKYGYTTSRAEKLKRQREKQREREREELGDIVIRVAGNSDGTFGNDEEAVKFESDIQRLRSQVSNIANRYQDPDSKVESMRYAFDTDYYPGAQYTRNMDLADETGYYMKERKTVDISDHVPKFLEADGHIYRLVSS